MHIRYTYMKKMIFVPALKFQVPNEINYLLTYPCIRDTGNGDISYGGIGRGFSCVFTAINPSTLLNGIKLDL